MRSSVEFESLRALRMRQGTMQGHSRSYTDTEQIRPGLLSPTRCVSLSRTSRGLA